jgi:putative DNA primase/helicase
MVPQHILRSYAVTNQSEAPVVSDAPSSPEVPVVSDTPSSPEVPVVSEAPSSPEVPVVSDTPSSPEVPVVSEVPNSPEVPVVSDAPSSAEGPKLSVLPKPEDNLRLMTTNYDGIVSERTEWLVDGLIPLGEMTILAGDPGLGKSQLTCSLIASVSRGIPWPSPEHECLQGKILHINSEDSPEQITKPRLMAAGADLRMVDDAKQRVDGSLTRPFIIKDDLMELRKRLERTPGYKLVVIDPAGVHLGVSNTGSNEAVRAVLNPLIATAKDFGVAVVLVTHLTKSKKADPIHRIPGSYGVVGASRAVYVIEKASDHRILYSAKNNYASAEACWAFNIEQCEVNDNDTLLRTSKVVIDPEMLPLPQDSSNGGEKSKGVELTRAMELIAKLLEDGSKPCKQVQEEVTAKGVSKSTFNRARKELDLQTVRYPDNVQHYQLRKIESDVAA